MARSGRSINLMLAYLLHLTKGEGETKWGRAGKNANIFHVGQVEWICWVSLAQNAKWSGSKEFHTMWIDQQETPPSTSLSLPPYSVLAPFQLLLLLLQTHVIVNDGGWANKPTNKQANKQCEAKPNEKREQGRERREGREEREKNSQRKHNPNKPKNVQQHREGAWCREREGEGERVLGAMSVRILTRKSHKLSVPRTNSLELL